MIKNFRKNTPNSSKAAFVAETAVIEGAVTLEEDSSIWYGAVLRADLEPIVIGKRSNIQENATIHVDFDAPVIIGEGVTVGHQAILHGCTIEDGALIGMGAIVLNRSVIGKESIVGAGALVTEGKVFPERSLILGSPAKVVKTLTDEDIEKIKKNTALYVTLAKEHAEENAL